MTRKIQLTTRQLNDLMADLGALPAEVVGSHLSDEAFFGYTTGTLDAFEMRRVDLHLASCVRCAAEAERLADASQVWFGDAGERRLAALRERLIDKDEKPSDQLSLSARLAEWLQEVTASWQATFSTSPQRLALAADTRGEETRQIWHYQSADGGWRGRAVLDFRGDVTFRFTSKDIALAGTRFMLRWGELEREVALRQASATAAGAKAVVLSHERPDDLSTPIELRIAE